LQRALGQLVAAELLYQRGVPPQSTYTFKHALIQDVAYHSLLVRRRKALHRAAGEAIEALYPERLAKHDEDLAYHFTHGEVWPKAMDYSVLAGDRAATAGRSSGASTMGRSAPRCPMPRRPCASPKRLAIRSCWPRR
jgi:predicted ATPase